MADASESSLSRREFVQGTVSSVALAGAPAAVLAAAAARNADKAAVLAQIPTMHAANVKRLQDWIALPSIAAENLNYPQGAEYMVKLAQDAGFTGVKLIPTSGKPGVFGTIDAGAHTTMGIYFMYDVKQYVPAEWSSPPLEAQLVQKESLGTVCMGRGAVNQKGPENAFLSALMAFRAAGKKLPVNLVLVCEGEEEIGSPHFREMIVTPEVMAGLRKCAGVFMPEAGQDRDGGVQVSLGAKGVVELELISSGEKWGRGGWPHPRRGRFFREGEAPDRSAGADGQGPRGKDRRKHGQEAAGGAALDPRCELGRFSDVAGVQADDKHRRTGRWVYGSGRQDRAAAQGSGEDRHAPGTGHDRRGYARQAESAPGQARVRRYRSQHEWRL